MKRFDLCKINITNSLLVFDGNSAEYSVYKIKKKPKQNKKGVLVKKTRMAIRNLIFFYPFYELYTSACIWFFYVRYY